MTRIQTLKKLIDLLYQEKRPGRDSWADYLYEEHIFLVADCAQVLSRRFGGEEELAIAGAMLHDIADARMSRFDINHAEESASIARDFLAQSGFNPSEIAIIVDDIMRNHGCSKNLPSTQEGKVMATADAMVHLTSDFYNHALSAKLAVGESMEKICEWALPKIERDFYKKIFFDEIRDEVRISYENCKQLFN